MEYSETILHAPNSDRILVIMAKAPRPGAVKTHLARSYPVEAVTHLYRCLLADTMAHSLPEVKVAIMCRASDVEELAQLAGGETGVVAQQGQGLAAGLTSVFAYESSKGPVSKLGHWLCGAASLRAASSRRVAKPDWGSWGAPAGRVPLPTARCFASVASSRAAGSVG